MVQVSVVELDWFNIEDGNQFWGIRDQISQREIIHGDQKGGHANLQGFGEFAHGLQPATRSVAVHTIQIVFQIPDDLTNPDILCRHGQNDAAMFTSQRT